MAYILRSYDIYTVTEVSIMHFSVSNPMPATDAVSKRHGKIAFKHEELCQKGHILPSTPLLAVSGSTGYLQDGDHAWVSTEDRVVITWIFKTMTFVQ